MALGLDWQRGGHHYLDGGIRAVVILSGEFGHYNATYGSLGVAIAPMIWMWMSTIIILFGAELNSEIEHQTLKDSTTGSAKPLGTGGAKMADTVGASYPR